MMRNDALAYINNTLTRKQTDAVRAVLARGLGLGLGQRRWRAPSVTPSAWTRDISRPSGAALAT
jgi:hypothetical protein